MELPRLDCLPETLYENIAQFTAASDTYSLCKTIRMSNETRKSCMHASLLNGLNQSLRKSKIEPGSDLMNVSSSRDQEELQNSIAPSILSSFILFAQHLPPKSIAISGSIILQGMYNVHWMSDVDIYCISAVAPMVRAWLFKCLNQVLMGYTLGYKFSANQSIEIVEKYCNVPRQGEAFVLDTSIDVYDEVSTDDSDYSLENRTWIFDYEKMYRKDCINLEQITLRSTKDVPFKYCPELFCQKNISKKDCATIDLIIGTHESTCADMLSQFDMLSVQSSFDGNTFRIVDPENTLMKQTYLCSGNDKNELIFAYANEFNQVCNRDMFDFLLSHFKLLEHFKWPDNLGNRDKCALIFSEDLDSQEKKHIKKFVMKVRQCIIHKVFKRLKLHGYKPVRCKKPIRSHNMMLFQYFRRIKKYQSRGITIMNAPLMIRDAMRILPQENGNQEEFLSFDTVATS